MGGVTPDGAHPTARCCWCGAGLVRWDGVAMGPWVCPASACQARQWQWSVVLRTPAGYVQEGGLLFVPTPKQVVFLETKARRKMFGGAAGPGKSHASRWGLYRLAMQIPGFEGLILRQTYPELERTHIREMQRELPLIGAEWVDSKRVGKFPNGSLIECGHMEDERSLQRYLSSEYDVIMPDEASQFDPRRLLEVSTRARTSNPEVMRVLGGAQFWPVTNPGGPAAALLKDLFITHDPQFDEFAEDFRLAYTPADWVYVPATLDDNPYIDPEYVQALATLQPWRYEQLRHGNWDVLGGKFFDWQASRNGQPWHVWDGGAAHPTDLRWALGLDWGRNSPGCVLWACVQPDEHLYVVDELKFQGEDVAAVAKKIRQRCQDLGLRKVPQVFADPSLAITTGQIGESYAQTFARHGVPLTLVSNDRVNGWGRVHEALSTAPDGRPWLQAHTRCRYLCRTLPLQQSSKTNPEDVDTSGDDHAADALRYLLMGGVRPGTVAKVRKMARGTWGWLKREALAQVEAMSA